MTDIAMVLSHETHEICPFKLHDSLMFKALECPWIWRLFMLTLNLFIFRKWLSEILDVNPLISLRAVNSADDGIFQFPDIAGPIIAD